MLSLINRSIYLYFKNIIVHNLFSNRFVLGLGTSEENLHKMGKVEIEQGVLIGGNNATEDGFQYYEFLNIPYAKPPVGDLRFKSPQPPEPWQGERDATTENPQGYCKHFGYITKKIEGSEDCLYLNVFTRKIPTPGEKPLPVMVYIHGGGFILGSGTIKKEVCGPDYLIKHDVVLVCINYRLGPFGFLCLDIPKAAGNMGLKDQVMALKWVQKNISAFGGDKENVTIFGLSAGGASVEYQLLSPLSKGLFHKAISMSGSTLNHWAINNKITNLSIRLAQELGCKSGDVDTMHKFLLQVPGDELVQASIKVSGFQNSKRTVFGFVPTVEKDFQNDDAFITDYPYNIMKNKKFHNVPLVKGFAEFEGLMVDYFKQNLVKEIMERKNLTQLFNHPVEESYINKLVKLYFDEYVKQDNDLWGQQVVNFCGDLDFSSGIWISSKLLSDKTTPTFVYTFTYNSSHTPLEPFLNREDNSVSEQNKPPTKRGASHGDDVYYVMHGESAYPYDSNDVITIKRLTKLWSDFAKTGDVTPTTSDVIPIKWPTFTVEDQKYMVIDNNLEVKAHYRQKEMAVFESIYEKYRNLKLLGLLDSYLTTA